MWRPASCLTTTTICMSATGAGRYSGRARNRQIYVFATLEPSIAAYHLAFGPDDFLYVSGPTTSSFDSIVRIGRDGHVERFYRGLGRPQGMAFDAHDNLYVAASLGGRRGVVRITPEAKAELYLSGPAIVGLAFSPSRAMILATNNVHFSGWQWAWKAGRFLSAHMSQAAEQFDAEIIAVGSEMLTSQRLDTNSLYITDLLNALGVEVKRKLIVGDDRALLTSAVSDALSRVKILILSGGLGPTEDDLTRDSVAQAMGRELLFRQDLCDAIEARFTRRGRVMAEINKRQAFCDRWS